MAGVSDPYRLLGVPRSASLTQIKAAHRALAKRYHPDSPTADPQRFLRVQEAYQLLADPLRRREWDARHSPAPVRADDPAPTRPRQRGRRPSPPPARDQASRSYTWSASEVPWWEEARDGRAARRGGSARQAAAPPPPPSESAGAAPEPPRPDFDVYNRSSGAAWSAAARAYFRRADQDLPRRGSFHYQGTQPLTAARARAAAAAAAPRTSASAGVAHSTTSINEARARARARARAERWPTIWQRLRYTALAWLPLAILVGYGAPVVAGCQDAGTACPEYLPHAQAATAALLLGGLFVLPKLAYPAALATSVLAVGGGTALLIAWLAGVRAPQLATLPPWALTSGAVLLGLAYLLIGAWLIAEPHRRPWVAAPAPGPRR